MVRDIAFQVVVGSQNYNLQDEHSDKDYKQFVLPTFADLYEQLYYKSSSTSHELDIEIHDVRKLERLFWKANVNFIEVLFSEEVMLPDGEEYYPFIREELLELFSLKHKIATMNLPYLYQACIGMHETKKKQLIRDVGKGNLVVASKHVFTSYRILDFLIRFAQNEFTDFKQGIYYSDAERDQLLQLKHHPYNESEWEKRLSEKLEKVIQLKAQYMNQTPNEQTRNYVNKLLYQIVYNYTRFQVNRR